MYQKHPLLETPPDDTKLWRYVDLPEFLSFLSRPSLYFAKLAEFREDPWEGAVTEGVKEGFKRDLLSLVDGVKIPNLTMREIIELLQPGLNWRVEIHDLIRRAIFGINCWHRNDVESVAMWKLYTQGKDGVAIQTTVNRLKSCLSHESRNIFIAAVHYSDHEVLPTNQDLISADPMIPIAVKRRSFEHETEVRVILNRSNNHPEKIEQCLSLRLENECLDPIIWGVNELEEFQRLKAATTGESLAVDIGNLVEKIVVSPEYPAWAIADLQDRVTVAGLAVTVERSDLLRKPSGAIEI